MAAVHLHRAPGALYRHPVAGAVNGGLHVHPENLVVGGIAVGLYSSGRRFLCRLFLRFHMGGRAGERVMGQFRR